MLGVRAWIVGRYSHIYPLSLDRFFLPPLTPSVSLSFYVISVSFIYNGYIASFYVDNRQSNKILGEINSLRYTNRSDCVGRLKEFHVIHVFFIYVPHLFTGMALHNVLSLVAISTFNTSGKVDYS